MIIHFDFTGNIYVLSHFMIIFQQLLEKKNEFNSNSYFAYE